MAISCIMGLQWRRSLASQHSTHYTDQSPDHHRSSNLPPPHSVPTHRTTMDRSGSVNLMASTVNLEQASQPQPLSSPPSTP
eukprot:6455593-Amphidinium_carterae.4